MLFLSIITLICMVVAVTCGIRLLVGVIKDDIYFNDFAWQIAMIISGMMAAGFGVILANIAEKI